MKKLEDRVDALEKAMLVAKVVAGVLGLSGAGLFIWITTLKSQVDSAKADAKTAQETALAAKDIVLKAQRDALAQIHKVTTEAVASAQLAIADARSAALKDVEGAVRNAIESRAKSTTHLVRVERYPIELGARISGKIISVPLELRSNQFVTVMAAATPYPSDAAVDAIAYRIPWACTWRKRSEKEIEIGVYSLWMKNTEGRTQTPEVYVFVWEGPTVAHEAVKVDVSPVADTYWQIPQAAR